MCGIAGLVKHSHPEELPWLAGEMLAALSHRGPDDFGVGALHGERLTLSQRTDDLAGADVALLHRRLSIIDLSDAGRQPIASEDGRFAICFNGEIYNYVELREELRALGERFTTETDTEVLLRAWMRWGKACLTRLVGMFAFAVLDVESRKLTLVRDFFGIKPLYVAATPSVFGFASELRALLQIPDITRRANPIRVAEYLRFGISDHGTDTILSDVHQLLGGTLLEVDIDSPRWSEPEHYWRPEATDRSWGSIDEAAGCLREAFLKSVGLHLRSDVPVGSCLSGGIDSSSIVSAMRQIGGDRLELHCFSHIASDAAISEERWVDVLGKHANAIVHKDVPTTENLVEDLSALVAAQQSPFGTTNIYAQYRLMRLAKQTGLKVLLDGQGADEMFGGYRFYVGARVASLTREGRWGDAFKLLKRASSLPGYGASWFAATTLDYLLPTSVQRVIRPLVGKELDPAWLDRAWCERHAVKISPPKATKGRDVLRQALVRSIVGPGLPQLLRYEDRNGMAFSIETRVPFLTPELVELALSMPESYIIGEDGTSKLVLRKAMRGLVPDAILDRRDKIGFETPEDAWLRSIAKWVESLLEQDEAREIPALKTSVAIEHWREIAAGARPYSPSVWRWINLIEWTRQFGVYYD